jgi:hypothetical protein
VRDSKSPDRVLSISGEQFEWLLALVKAYSKDA